MPLRLLMAPLSTLALLLFKTEYLLIFSSSANPVPYCCFLSTPPLMDAVDALPSTADGSQENTLLWDLAPEKHTPGL